MAIAESVFELLNGAEDVLIGAVAIGGVAGFTPLTTVGQLLLARGLMKDLGRGVLTRPQLTSLKSDIKHRSDLLEMQTVGARMYIRARY